MSIIKNKVDNGTHSYVVIRTDLSHPQMIVQSCHACIEMARNHMDEKTCHPSLVVCSTENEASLIKIIQQLRKKGIGFKSFYEPDIDNLTAICTEPLGEKDRMFFATFNLVCGNTVQLESIDYLKAILKQIAFDLKQSKIELKEFMRGNFEGNLYTLIRRVNFLKHQYRHHHIAFCELRGKLRKEIEIPDSENPVNEKYLGEIKRKYYVNELWI